MPCGGTKMNSNKFLRRITAILLAVMILFGEMAPLRTLKVYAEELVFTEESIMPAETTVTTAELPATVAETRK